MKTVLERQLLPIAIIHNAGEIRGKTRLQKLVFLAQEEASAEFYSFEDLSYGPHSRKLTQDMEELETKGIVNVNRTTSVRGNTTPTYSINESVTVMDALATSVASEIANKVITEYGNYSIRSLVEEVGEFEEYSSVYY